MTDERTDQPWAEINKPRRVNAKHRREISDLPLPQQEELEKVVGAVEFAHLDDEQLSRRIAPLGIRPKEKATARNVLYYRRNARILGLTDDDNIPTPAGRALSRLAEDEKIMRLAHAFEASRLGQAWIHWANVSQLEQLVPQSAEAFVAHVRTYQKQADNETWKRRAHTLRCWCERFQDHRRQHDGLLKDPPHRPAPPEHPLQATAPIFDRGSALKIIQDLSVGSSRVDVATAYFSLHGYHDLMSQLERADLRLLIGANDQARDQLANLLQVFAASLEPDLDLNLAQMREIAVRLHRQLVRGRVRVRYFEPKELDNLHAKVLIFDKNRAYVTSSNLTKGGLRINVECGYQVIKADEAHYLHDRFELYFEKARPIGEPVIDRIERSWAFWGFADPYLVFLKVLDALFGRLPRVRQVRYELAEFQRAIVATLLSRYESRRKLMLIAPTGMGKTIMAGYVAKVLQEHDLVDRIVIACKNGSIFEMWRDTLRNFSIAVDRVRVYDLERTDDGRDPGAGTNSDLNALFRSLTERDLVIVDECHHFRRRAAKRQMTLERFLAGPDLEQPAPRALLMTATPISTGIENLQTLATLVDDKSIENIVDVARAQGVISIALGPILRDFGVEDGRWIGLRFAEQLRYFPHLDVRSVPYTSSMVPVFDALAEMNFVLGPKKQNYACLGLTEDDVDELGGQHGIIRCLLARRAESSPAALESTIESLRDGLVHRRLTPKNPRRLGEQLDQLEALLRATGKDSKVSELIKILGRRKPREKVLVFTEYRATADHLYEVLSKNFGQRNIGLVTGNISTDARRAIFCRFAPIAQNVDDSTKVKHIEVLVATDAIAEGENLQDATLVVNYDVNWTPMRLVQRVGRVDRFTPTRRSVKVRNFFPKAGIYEQIVGLWSRLEQRSAQLEMLSGTSVVGDRCREPIGLARTDVELMEDLYRGDVALTELREKLDFQLPPTSMFDRLWGADVNALARARALPDGIQARIAGERPGLYVLLKYGRKNCALFRPAGSSEWQEAPGDCAHEELLANLCVEQGASVLEPRKPLDDEVDRLVREWLKEQPQRQRLSLRVLAAIEVRDPRRGRG